MHPETKKYIKKRRQIIDILLKIKVGYEDDVIAITTTPDIWESRLASEEILKRFGINKPKELTDAESAGFMHS